MKNGNHLKWFANPKLHVPSVHTGPKSQPNLQPRPVQWIEELSAKLSFRLPDASLTTLAAEGE